MNVIVVEEGLGASGRYIQADHAHISPTSLGQVRNDLVKDLLNNVETSGKWPATLTLIGWTDSRAYDVMIHTYTDSFDTDMATYHKNSDRVHTFHRTSYLTECVWQGTNCLVNTWNSYDLFVWCTLLLAARHHNPVTRHNLTCTLSSLLVVVIYSYYIHAIRAILGTFCKSSQFGVDCKIIVRPSVCMPVCPSVCVCVSVVTHSHVTNA